jgi:predicted metal-dependent peptidase
MAKTPNSGAIVYTAGIPDGSCGFHEMCKKIKDIKSKLTPESKAQYEKDADTYLRQATIQLLVKQPFFGLLLCNMDRQPMWNLPTPTMAVDGVHLFFDPVFVMISTRGEHRADLCHEVLHLALMHLTRRKGRNPKRWNRAIDYADNQIVVDECELPLQKWACYEPTKFKGMVAEQIYKILEKEEEEQGGGGGKDKSPGEGGCPDCQQESEDGDGDGDQHVMDGHGTPKITEDEIIDKVVRAAEQARSQGNLPASIDTLIKRLRKSKVDWRKFIRGRALDYFNKKDYKYEIRSIITGPVARAIGVRSTWLPGLGSEETKTLAVVIDTSGSVSKKLLMAFASEVKGCMQLADKTIVITADAAVHEVIEVSKFDDILRDLKFRGQGGTDFRPAFDKLKEMHVDPEMLIYFTDAWGAFPAKKPAFPVVWALTKNHGEVPWGESVVCTDDKDEAWDGE